MIPRTIHLIWLGEITEEALDAKAHFEQNGEGRQVILHTDNSLLLPEFLSVYNHLTTFQQKGDLLRYSIISQIGGWYFDVDVRLANGTSLDAIEEKYRLDGSRCLITNVFLSGFINNDILAASPNWSGSTWINEYIQASSLEYEIRYIEFSGIMLLRALANNSDHYVIGDDNEFCIDSECPLMLRQGVWKLPKSPKPPEQIQSLNQPLHTNEIFPCDTCPIEARVNVSCWRTVNYGCGCERARAEAEARLKLVCPLQI